MDNDVEVSCGHTCVIETMKPPNGSIFIKNNECQATYQDGVIVDAEKFL